MKNLLSSGLAKKLVLLSFIAGLVSPLALAQYQVGPVTAGSYQNSPVTAGSYQNGPVTTPTTYVASVAPSVQGLSVSPDSYNPSQGNLTVSFSLNTQAQTTVWIKDANDIVKKTLLFDSLLNAGQVYSYTWNGRDNGGNIVASGHYKAVVVAYNTIDTDVETYNFVVNAQNPQTLPDVTISANPSTINVSNAQTSVITYTLNTAADLSVVVKNGSQNVKTLRSLSAANAGTATLVWDGKNADYITLPNGTYTVEATATNSAGSDTAVTSVTLVSTPAITAPVLSNVYVSPTSFNPEATNTRLYFTLDKTATVAIYVKNSNGSVIRTLASGLNYNSGSYFQEWNGTDSSGNRVSSGTYTFEVTASNSAGSDNESASVIVTGQTGCAPVISSNYSNPSSFDPSEDDLLIYFTTTKTADITLKIKDGSTTVKTLINDQTLSAGSRTYSFNGRDLDGDILDRGTYRYELTAQVSGCSNEVQSGSFTITTEGNNDDNDWSSTDEDLIRDVIVTNEVFDPTEGERARISFELTDDADLIVQVMDGNRVIKTLHNTNNQSEGDYTFYWDGRNSNGNIVADDVYEFRVMADNGSDTDTDRAYTEVDTDGIIIGFPDNARCAGFRDVSINSPFCKAIELMSKKKIFEGYSDGTFRPYERITRAETTKVITLALDYDIVSVSGNYRRFSDLAYNAWYIPYLETAYRNDVIHGYPDGTFRPGNTINRVELLKIFLRANRVSFPTCTKAPFEDTPIQKDTEWYMPYACYAKVHGLLNAEFVTKLYPAEAMTRGDVADLFYDFEVKGLYDNYNGDNGYVPYSDYDQFGNDYYYNQNNNDYYYDYYSGRNYQDGYYVYRNGRYEWISY